VSSYDNLRDAIVRGDIAPNSRLVEADLTSAFQMSRGAVRNALIRLEEEGLVVRERHRGARVRHISDAEAVEILQARAALEGLTARQAAERIDEDGAERLLECLGRHRALLEGGDLLGASDANADLHATIIALSGHSTAKRLIRMLSSQTVRYQFRTILIPGRSSASAKEHTTIVEAVVAGRADEAEQAMRQHLFNVAEALRTRGSAGSATRGVVEGTVTQGGMR
jgi:DNA-binding GntR family transcriptional regulator